MSIHGVQVHQLLAVGFKASTVTSLYCTSKEHSLMKTVIVKAQTSPVGSLTYFPQFDCFVKIVEVVQSPSNNTLYRVENAHENIINMLVNPSEVYGVIRFN